MVAAFHSSSYHSIDLSLARSPHRVFVGASWGLVRLPEVALWAERALVFPIAEHKKSTCVRRQISSSQADHVDSMRVHCRAFGIRKRQKRQALNVIIRDRVGNHRNCSLNYRRPILLLMVSMLNIILHMITSTTYLGLYLDNCTRAPLSSVEHLIMIEAVGSALRSSYPSHTDSDY